MNAFKEGFAHITDWQGADHMLFLLAIAAGLTYVQWRSLLRITIAFTIGHSLALVPAAMGWIPVPRDVVELLIPCTIIAAAVRKWINAGEEKNAALSASWVLLFGLIHGMGFSSYFRMLFDDPAQIVQNLFLFNVGIEAGQLLIVGALVLVNSVLIIRMGLSKNKVLIAQLLLAISVSVALLTALIASL